VLLAKALLLSRCYYLLDCNGIPAPMLNKITNSVCRFVRGPYSHMPYSFLSAPLSRGGLNCPSLKERKLAYDAKFMGDLISEPLNLPWKAWAHTDLSCASSKPGKLPGTDLNPLLQRSMVRLSSLEPRLRHAYVSCRVLRYDVSCAFPSLAARLDMPSTYHPAVPLRANRFSDDLVRRHVTTVGHLTWPGTKLTRAAADPMPFRQRGLLGSAAKSASDLYAHARVSCWGPASDPSDSCDSDDSDLSDAPAPRVSVQSLAATRLALLKPLSLTCWRSSKWWPDTSLLHGSVRVWPAMRNAYGCARLLNSDQSLLARPDRAGNFLANKRFFQKYHAAPLVSLSRPCRVPAEWQLVWTDGSALDNGHPSCSAGSAWASLCGRSQLCRLAGPLLSNNIAELCAVLLALRAWPDCTLHIHTDSTYVLGLVRGGLLAMERDGWLDAPIFSSRADIPAALGFTIPALGVHMRYGVFSLGSLKPLFQALLFELRSHSSRLRFSKVRAHANDYMNNLVDLLAKQALLPSSPVLVIADVSAPPGWVDSGPVLNCQLLAFLTDIVVSSSPPPFANPKFAPFFSSWSSWMALHFLADLDPVAHVPLLWRVNVPVGLRELLYKHVSSCLPIGDSWHGGLALGQTCRCGATMSLDHVWHSCPSYDLSPLMLTLSSRFEALHPDPEPSTSPLSWPRPFWYPLLALWSLDCDPINAVVLRRCLGRSRVRREWALGSFLWFVWKQRTKEIHDDTYRFIPALHTDALEASFSAD